jgi:hypothetical protein
MEQPLQFTLKNNMKRRTLFKAGIGTAVCSIVPISVKEEPIKINYSALEQINRRRILLSIEKDAKRFIDDLGHVTDCKESRERLVHLMHITLNKYERLVHCLEVVEGVPEDITASSTEYRERFKDCRVTVIVEFKIGRKTGTTYMPLEIPTLVAFV